jgi:hippurate hydrolase
MPIHNRIAAFAEDMTAWRRDLHAHPELGLEEHRTAAIVDGQPAVSAQPILRLHSEPGAGCDCLRGEPER